jgi:hypothetical protein
MTTIVVQVTTTPTALPSGITFAAISVAITDNSGAALPVVKVNGSETPPFSVTVSGNSGPNQAMAVLTALDTNGNPIGSPVSITESGTGGVVPGTFPAPTGGTITVS